MSLVDLQNQLCWAGRWAFLEGCWLGVVCGLPPIHVIATDDVNQPIIRLCQVHFKEALDAGWIDEPFIDREELERRNPKVKDVRDAHWE